MDYKSAKQMKRKVKGAWFAILYLIPVVVFWASCKDEEEPIPAPVIAGFTPAAGGLPGSTATITGQNFGATAADNTVQFNGVTASVTAATTTQLTVTVPQATTGKITVTVNGKTATSANDFIVLAPAPVLTDFSPKTGRAGAAVTITGMHFSKTLAENIVKFNGVAAKVTQASETSLTMAVPDGSITGKITVSVNGQEAVSTADFEPIHTVYIAGYSYDAINSYTPVAEYWKDGELTSLTDGTGNSGIYSMDVIGQDVYLAGVLGDVNTTYAAYWKNGTAVKLTDDKGYGEAKVIDVIGDDIHVAGRTSSKITYWKNGVPTYLTDGTTSTEVAGMAIVGTDVYIVGSVEDMGMYWKNGVAHELGEYAYPAAIAVQGNDIHIVYYKNNAVYYWKNGASQRISDGTNEASPWNMIVVGTDVHIVGRDGSKAAYWKNGTSIPLEEGRDAYAIFILGSDVYITGTDSGNRAKYWKNGVTVNLTEEISGHEAQPVAVIVR